VVVVGASMNVVHSDMVIWRFDDEGALDDSFGGDGIVIYDRGADDRGYGVTMDGEGRVVATGVSDSGAGDDFLVWRYTAAGEPDTSFSGDGVAVYNGGFEDQGWGVGIDSRQRVVAVGMSGLAGGSNDMAAIRLTDNGSFDATFDGDGVVTFQIQAGTRNDAGSVAFDATGRIVMAGSVEFPVPPPPINMTFWRYE
nr:hypothetical protein [bacterium]